MSDEKPKCEVCGIYQKQDNKRVCVKCDSMGFVPGNEKTNRAIADAYMERFNKILQEIFPDTD